MDPSIKLNQNQFNRDFSTPSQVHQPQKIANTIEVDAQTSKTRPLLKTEEITPNSVDPLSKTAFGNDQNRNALKQTPFWADDPNILLFQITALFPTQSMSYNEQLNAISRLVILLSILLFFVFKKPSFLIVCIFTLFIIWVVQYSTTKKIETLENPVDGVLMDQDISANYDPAEIYDTPPITNPFSNVMLTDYASNPLKKPAPPIDDIKTQDAILSSAKELVARAHPTIPELADRLFSNLGDNYDFEKSMRPFVSNNATTIPNDQQAFSDFCYGDMISCKEGNLFACARNLTRHQNM